jgi:hypothetical protein
VAEITAIDDEDDEATDDNEEVFYPEEDNNKQNKPSLRNVVAAQVSYGTEEPDDQ